MSNPTTFPITAAPVPTAVLVVPNTAGAATPTVIATTTATTTGTKRLAARTTVWIATAAIGVAISVGAYWFYRHHLRSQSKKSSVSSSLTADEHTRTAQGRDHFSAIAERYDQHPAVKVVHPAIVRALTQWSAERPGAGNTVLPFALSSASTDVLDFGCGPGSLALALAPFVRSILAVDTAPGMIDVLKKRIAASVSADPNSGADRIVPCLSYIRSAADLPASHTRQFDVVLSSLAFHHIADPRAVLSVLSSVLKPGGALVLIEMERSDAFASSLHMMHAKGHGAAAHKHDHAHTHTHDHAHSHDHSHDHSTATAAAASSGTGSDVKQYGPPPPDVFHAGFEVDTLIQMCRDAGLTVARPGSTAFASATATASAGTVVSPFVQVPGPGGLAPACLLVAIKPVK